MGQDINRLKNLKVALVHDWLTGMRGGEKVLDALCKVFPQADVFTLLWNRGSVSKRIESHKIYTSFLQNLPLVEKRYRYYLPLMPKAILGFNFEDYDLVISTSHCVAKGARVKKTTPHICYCFTPMRYIWDQYNEYFNSSRSGFITHSAMSLIRPYLQKWDVKTADRVTKFVSISKNIQNKIKKYYNRDSEIIYPPVDVDNYPEPRDEDYFLMVTAMVPYKRVDLAIEAFNELKYPLKVIGTGPDEKRLKSIANSNVEFLGWLSDNEIKNYYAGCRAFLFPQEEDFGITAVEAQAAGKPVIAYAKGGALETVVDNATGVFFQEPTVKSLKEAVLKLDKTKFSSDKIKENSKSFSTQKFEKEIIDMILGNIK